MVVCIGMGTSLGSHYRGGALGEVLQSYGNLRGFIVVAACGNEGNAAHHFNLKELGARQETDVELRVDSGEDGFTTELWCKVPGLCSVGLISPGGEYSGRTYARVGERQVIRLRFGLEDGKTHTLEEIGDELNVTRERVRQIEARAMEKLRSKATKL